MKELIEYWQKQKIITDKQVLEAFKKVKRENFIPKNLKDYAYLDKPLPIGFGQTISQPTTIAIMTQALELKPGMKVLEIGTGSGYQAAILACIVGNKREKGKAGKVISIEIIPELTEYAKENLKKEKITNTKVFHSDGSLGYKKEAPYDRIIVTAACPKIPKSLLKQLKNNGILVAPVGYPSQNMMKIKKDKTGKQTTTENLGEFIFVPLTGKYGWK